MCHDVTALTGWSEFNVASAGASAALAGLIIVAMSVNITRIVESPTLPTRAGAAIGALVLAVAVACLALIPGHAVRLLGIETLVGASTVLFLDYLAIRAISGTPGLSVINRAMKILVGAIPPLAFTVGAIVMITGDDSGYIWIAVGSVLAVIGGVLFSWIALVEILR
jgi:hypothetical protein